MKEIDNIQLGPCKDFPPGWSVTFYRDGVTARGPCGSEIRIPDGDMDDIYEAVMAYVRDFQTPHKKGCGCEQCSPFAKWVKP